jgi:hypothetical protein
MDREMIGQWLVNILAVQCAIGTMPMWMNNADVGVLGHAVDTSTTEGMSERIKDKGENNEWRRRRNLEGS